MNIRLKRIEIKKTTVFFHFTSIYFDRIDSPRRKILTRKEFERFAGNSSGPSWDFPINQRGREISLMDVGHEPLKWTCRPFDLPRTWPGCRENCVTVERSSELGVCTPISPSAFLLRSPCHQPFLRYSISPLRSNLRVRSFVRTIISLASLQRVGRTLPGGRVREKKATLALESILP